MAKSDNILGVSQIEMGAPGDGIMGASLTAFSAVELNSVSFSGASATDETIETESEDAYLTIGTSAEATSMTFRLYEVFEADAVLLLGGTWDAMTNEYRAPETVADIYLSLRLTTKPISGFYMEIEFPYAKISARHEGSITKGALMALEVTATANTPVSAAQVKGPPYTIRRVSV